MPTIRTGTSTLGTSGIGSPLSIAVSTPGPASSRVSSSPTSRPVRRWYAAEMATSSVAVASGTRPASTICSSIGSPIGSDARGKSLFVPGWPATSNPLTANSCIARTYGSASTGSQSKPGWLGSAMAVIGRVRSSSRATTVALRRAPTNADSTTPPPIASSTASTSAPRHRRRASWPTHVHHAVMRSAPRSAAPRRRASARRGS